MFSKLFGTSPQGQSGVRKVPSFDDLSMGAGEDVQAMERSMMQSRGDTEVQRSSMDSQRSGSVPASPRTNVWQEVFNPGRNFSPKMDGRDTYDNVPEGGKAPTLHEYIAKAEHLKRLSLMNIDKNGDGFIDAAELRGALGPQADVQQLISAADKNGDGKISYFEFTELMKQS